MAVRESTIGKVIRIMKKGLFAFVLAALLSVTFAIPAFAAEINADEQKVYDEFAAVVDGKSWLKDEFKNQYKTEAQNALLKVDLDANACAEFSQVVKDVDAELAGCNSQKEAKQHLNTILKIINDVAGKYNMKVSVNAKNYAVVTVNGSVVATTATGVNQTGFGLAQTALVLAAAVATLAGAFVVARKNSLFA